MKRLFFLIILLGNLMVSLAETPVYFKLSDTSEKFETENGGGSMVIAFEGMTSKDIFQQIYRNAISAFPDTTNYIITCREPFFVSVTTPAINAKKANLKTKDIRYRFNFTVNNGKLVVFSPAIIDNKVNQILPYWIEMAKSWRKDKRSRKKNQKSVKLIEDSLNELVASIISL